MRDDFGWRKLEERREEEMLLYGKRLGNILKNSGGVGWWEDRVRGTTEKIWVKTEDQESASGREWKSRMEKVNVQDCTVVGRS